MNRLRNIMFGVAILGVTGCAGAVKLDNVAGSWTCPRVDGVCAEIAAIDRGLGATPSALVSIAAGAEGDGSALTQIYLDGGSASLPSRTPDQVARIVFAPSVDAEGHYHGARVVYAVITPGRWIAKPAATKPTANPVTAQATSTSRPMQPTEVGVATDGARLERSHQSSDGIERQTTNLTVEATDAR